MQIHTIYHAPYTMHHTPCTDTPGHRSTPYTHAHTQHNIHHIPCTYTIQYAHTPTRTHHAPCTPHGHRSCASNPYTMHIHTIHLQLHMHIHHAPHTVHIHLHAWPQVVHRHSIGKTKPALLIKMDDLCVAIWRYYYPQMVSGTVINLTRNPNPKP